MSEIIKFPFAGSSTPASNADSPAEPITDADFENADSDDLARVYRFDLAQDSEMISPTVAI
jgi:hypothetical protein